MALRIPPPAELMGDPPVRTIGTGAALGAHEPRPRRGGGVWGASDNGPTLPYSVGGGAAEGLFQVFRAEVFLKPCGSGSV